MADNEIAIKVEGVAKTFKLPHEKNSSIKGTVINFYKRDKSYEKQEALKGISFEIKKGEFFGIVGKNGSGKSTLLKLLAGIYSPDSGNIQVNGKLIPFIELGVGFSPELSGRENVFLNGALLGFNRKEMNAMYNDIVEFSELKRFMDQKLKNYSSGMQVRLAFSIAIRAKGDILLLDEVLAVGDAAFQQKCFDYFERLKKRQQTVVFVSHDMSAVRRFCNKAVYIKNGELIASGEPADIADIYAEENIQTGSAGGSEDPAKSLPGNFKLESRLYDQTATSVTFEAAYDAHDEQAYIGISVLSNGLSFAEVSTDPHKPLTGKGKATYRLDTTHLNSGTYEITAALFRLENRKLIAISHNKASFNIKGADITKGGSLKLADSWSYGK